MAIASSSYKKARAAAEPRRVLRWLDYVPMVPLAIAAAVLALSPPLAEPHLWQNLKLLAAGQLVEPIDVLDFLLHTILLVVFVLKLVRVRALDRAASR